MAKDKKVDVSSPKRIKERVDKQIKKVNSKKTSGEEIATLARRETAEVNQTPANVPVDPNLPVDPNAFSASGGQGLSPQLGETAAQAGGTPGIGEPTGNPMADRMGIDQGVQFDETAPPELPGEAPLWLKLIRGALTPVPPLAAIPHMFIKGMERKRAGAMKEDRENFQYFLQQFEKNPKLAIGMANTSPFRETLLRVGVDKEDLESMDEMAANNPFTRGQYLQAVISNVGEVPKGTEGSVSIGEKGFKKNQIKKPMLVGANHTLVDQEGTVLFDASKQAYEEFKAPYKQEHPKASDLETMLAYRSLTGDMDRLGVVASGGNFMLYDKSYSMEDFKKGKGIVRFNAKTAENKNIKVQQLKSYGGKTIGMFVVDTDSGKPALDENGQPIKNPDGSDKMIYNHQMISVQDMMEERLKKEVEDNNLQTREEIEEATDTVFEEIWKGFWDGYSGDESKSDGLDPEAKRALVDPYFQQVQSAVDDFIFDTEGDIAPTGEIQ